MSKNFEATAIKLGAGRHGIRFWLRVAAGVLTLFNCVALFFYLAPPGGSKKDLQQQSLAVRNQILLARSRTARLSNVAAKVTVGNTESGEFAAQYFLPKRVAYAQMIAEIQRMAKAAGFQERDAIYTEEPIEGTDDLDLLNCTANYEGTYENLLHFLYEVDHSPMLLMLENLQAAPQQRAGQINTSIRFQAVMKEDASPAGQQYR
jgi:Tfp pilus assembly protein PilO